ncbi:hypothetical protein [Vibrio cincinnatiensis]|uniref:hypothetical protein n=1 Tax=Vibrio cincinnatiensis TaxID=675 RepID=UPI001BB20DD9|nr:MULTISPECIES: hypothetical protein [Vibrio]
MTDFIIVLNNARVQAHRVINNQLEPILFAGELKLDVNDFWQKFEQKIEYTQDEKLALILIADDPEFAPDPHIKIAEQFEHDAQTLAWLIEELSFPAARVHGYPTVEVLPSDSRMLVKAEVPNKEVLVDEPLPNSSLQAFYRKKTRNYRAR